MQAGSAVTQAAAEAIAETALQPKHPLNRGDIDGQQAQGTLPVSIGRD